MFFSYTLAYNTVSIKIDFASIWLSMEEYIEYFSKKNAVTDDSHACCNTVSQQKQGQIGVKIQYSPKTTYSNFQFTSIRYIWSDIFYTCWYWSVKPTCAATPPSPCCAPSPTPPPPCLTSPSPPHEGRGYSARWRRWLGSFCCRRRTLALLVSHRWCNHYCLLPCQASVCDTDLSPSAPE